MKNIRKYLLLISLLILASFIFIGPYLLKNLPFVYGGDLQPQWYEFYTEIQKQVSLSAIIKYFRFPFYSWDIFLGNNFWASKVYYGLSDVFNYFTLYLPVHFYTAFEIQLVLKIMVAGLSFYYLAKEINENFRANVIVALAYALSSWMIYYIGQMTFASFYALFPLYLLGLEKYYKNKSFVLYIISTAFLLMTNFYLFFSLVIFTIIYVFYRYYVIHKNYHGFIKSTSILFIYAIIAVLITAIFIYPTVLYMFGNDRLGELKQFLVFPDIQIYLHQLVSQFLPSHLVIYQDNPFETSSHTTREILFWAGSINALLLPQILSEKDREFKKASLIVIITLLIIFIFPIGNSIMHGFSQASFRWLFLFISFNLLLTNRYLSDLTKLNLKILKISLLSIIGLMLIVLLISISIDTSINEILNYPRTLFAFVFSITGILLTYFFIINKNKNTLTFLLVLTFIELTFAGYLNLVQRRMDETRTWEFENNVTHVLEGYPNQLNELLDSLEPGNAEEYYRVFIPHDSIYWQYSHNMSIHYNLQGLMTYDSTYAPSFNDMKTLTDEVKAFNSDWLFNILNEDLVNFLNMKYAIVLDESELPHKDFTLMVEGYLDAFNIYRNDQYRPLGTLYSDIIDYDTYASFYQNDLSLLNTTIIAKNENIKKIQTYMGSNLSLVWNSINHYDNHLDGSFVTKDKGFMVLTLPYDKGWQVKVNNQIVKTYSVNGGFIGIPVEQGSNTLEMNFIPEGFKMGTILSLIGVLSFIGLLFKPLFRK